MMEPFAWVVLALSFGAYLAALQIGPSCADTVAPYSAVAFIGSFFWVAYLQEKKKGGRR